MSFKAGISPFGEINELMGAVNWVHDTFKPQNKNRYFSFCSLVNHRLDIGIFWLVRNTSIIPGYLLTARHGNRHFIRRQRRRRPHG